VFAAMTGQAVIEVRRLEPDDAAEVHRLRLRALREHPTAFLSDADTESARSVGEVAKRIGVDDDHLTLGAFAGIELVGMATLVREQRRKQNHRAGIHAMHVAAEWQGQGIGGRLLDGLIDHARRQSSLTRLTLGVIVGNQAARRLYLSRGFVTCGVDPAMLRHDGVDYDDELMTLDLTGPVRAPGRHSALSGFIIDCQGEDLDAAAAFWSAALGMPERILAGAEGRTYRRLLDPTGRLHVEVQLVHHASRVHLDIEADDVEAEVRRLEALGAVRVESVQGWRVMQAPTGQRFCVVPRQSPP
jgi:RimJ/RimL family protein N-acetyltransferase